MDADFDELRVDAKPAEPVADEAAEPTVEPAEKKPKPLTQRQRKNRIWEFKMLRKTRIRAAKRRKGSKLTGDEAELVLAPFKAAYSMGNMSASN